MGVVGHAPMAVYSDVECLCVRSGAVCGGTAMYACLKSAYFMQEDCTLAALALFLTAARLQRRGPHEGVWCEVWCPFQLSCSALRLGWLLGSRCGRGAAHG